MNNTTINANRQHEKLIGTDGMRGFLIEHYIKVYKQKAMFNPSIKFCATLGWTPEKQAVSDVSQMSRSAVVREYRNTFAADTTFRACDAHAPY